MAARGRRVLVSEHARHLEDACLVADLPYVARRHAAALALRHRQLAVSPDGDLR